MKRISVPKPDIDALVAEFRKQLTDVKTNTTKIVFEKSFDDLMKIDTSKVKKPAIFFSLDAWTKMNQLVKTCSDEIAWQATVEKKPYNEDKPENGFYYFVDKVYVYPQKVTGTFVDVDPVAYTEWSLKLPDEIYNSFRFQGHSHVNMGTSPSGTDTNTYQTFLDQLKEDDFYIFMILNKRGEFNLYVYDYEQDIIFENDAKNEDCYVDVLTTSGELSTWIEENMKRVEKKQTPPASPYAGAYGGYGYYNDDYMCYHDPYGKAPTQKPTTQKTAYKDGVEWASDFSYKRNGHIIMFDNDIDRAKFFIAHPDCITDKVPNKNAKEIMKRMLACKRGKK